MVETNKFFKALKCCCLILFQVSMVLGLSETRVVGGTPTTIDKAPYLVQLLFKGSTLCTGALVADEFVVTAAHCVKDKTPAHLIVKGGFSKQTEIGVRSKVSKIMMPKAYNYTTYHSDVAVVKLVAPLTGASIQSTKLCKTAWKHGDPVQVFGWGKTLEGDEYVPLELQTVEVNVIDKETCSEMYRNRIEITDTMFCAAAPGKDACSGDSGGPAMVNGEFCGVISWGIGCARSDSPGVYTSIPGTLAFIQNAMQQ